MENRFYQPTEDDLKKYSKQKKYLKVGDTLYCRLSNGDMIKRRIVRFTKRFAVSGDGLYFDRTSIPTASNYFRSSGTGLLFKIEDDIVKDQYVGFLKRKGAS